jgi:SAM-dependent methyltransferase
VHDPAVTQELIGRVLSYVDTTVVMAAAHLGIADHLSADAPRSSKEVAAEMGLDVAATKRLLRSLSGTGIVTDQGDDRFLLGPAGAALRSEPGSLRSLFRMFGTIGAPVLQGMLSVRTGAPAFDAVNGMPLFEYLAAHPEEGAVFNAAMTEAGAAVGLPAVHTYDFSGVRTFVDVGGGLGQLTMEVLRTNPQVEGVIFDSPEVITETEAAIEQAGLAGRCTAVGGNFFESVPAGDCIALRWVIHDWSDDEALTILRNCRQAIAPDGRLLLFEVVMPDGDGPHMAKSLDWIMLCVATGQERTEAEHAELLDRAGFRLTRVIPSPTPMSIVEAIPA